MEIIDRHRWAQLAFCTACAWMLGLLSGIAIIGELP